MSRAPAAHPSPSSSKAGGSSVLLSSSQGARRYDPGPVYEIKPPGWRPPLSGDADLGYPDYFPNRPGHGQDEDHLSESFIRQGYVSKWGLSNSSETYSVHGLVLQSLGRTKLKTLNDSMSSLLARRQDESAAVDPHTYKIPPRLVLHETKKQAYIADLANPTVPLHKLSRSIPHGFKGVDLLEMHAVHEVALDRALWFIKVCGGSELISMRSAKSQNLTPQAQLNAANLASATYTTDFTNAFATFLKSQLAQITVPATLPSVLRTSATFSVKSSFKSILSTTATRDKWLKKWGYSNRLLRLCLLPEHALIDRRALLGWVVTTLASANVAQIGFVVKLLEEHSSALHLDGALSRTFLENALGRLTGDLAGKKELEATTARLSKAIQCLFLSAPHLFVSPRLYTQHLAQLDLLLSPATAGSGMLPPFIAREDPLAHEILAAMGDAWAAVKARNNALLFGSWGIGGGKGVWSERKGTLGDIWILDSITALSDMARVAKAFFASLPSHPPHSTSSSPAPVDTALTLNASFAVKLDILLSWAVAKSDGRSRSARAQRSYAVATILSHFLAARSNTASQPPAGWPTLVQDEVYRWIEDSTLARAEENIETVADVLGELARRNVVSYAAYLMQLIARGMTWSVVGSSVDSQHLPHQLRLLRSIPLFNASQSIRHQRQVVLYGSSPSGTYPTGWDTSTVLDSCRGELIAAFPEILLGFHFEDESLARGTAPSEVAPLETTIPTLLHAPCFIQVEAVDRVLLSAITSPESPPPNSALLFRVIMLLERLGNYSAVLDIIVLILESSSDEGVLESTIDCVKRCTDIWTAMDAKARLVEALLERYLISRTTATPHRALLGLLLQAADAGLLHEELKSALLQDQAVFHMDQSTLPLFFGNVAPSPGPTDDLVSSKVSALQESAEGSMGKALWSRYVDASELLKYLTRSGYEKHILSDEAELVSQALKGLEGRPSTQFVTTATQRLSATIERAAISATSTRPQLDAFVEDISGVLQIVALSLAQSKPSDSTSTSADCTCDPRLAPLVTSVLEALLVLCVSSEACADVKWALVVSVRLLHVFLGLVRNGIAQVWTAGAKAHVDSIISSLLRLAIVHAGTATLDKEMFELLLDTLWTFLDDLPKDLKASALTSLRIFQTTENPQLSPSIPDELKAELSAILPQVSNASWDSGLLLLASDGSRPAIEKWPARPWEWNEQIEPPAPPLSHRDSFFPPQPVRNTASVSLALFRAEGTREHLPKRTTCAWFSADDVIASTAGQKDMGGWAALRSEQTYTDELEGSSFARDHLNSLTDVPLPDEVLQAERPSLNGSAEQATTPSSTWTDLSAVAGKPGKTSTKRKASTSSASGPPAQRLKGSSAANAVVLDGADQLEPKGKKGAKPSTSKVAGGQRQPAQAKADSGGAAAKKRKNSTA